MNKHNQLVNSALVWHGAGEVGGSGEASVKGGGGEECSSSESEADGTADGMHAFVVEIDDEMDEDMIAVLLDPPPSRQLPLFASEARLLLPAAAVACQNPPARQQPVVLHRSFSLCFSLLSPCPA